MSVFVTYPGFLYIFAICIGKSKKRVENCIKKWFTLFMCRYRCKNVIFITNMNLIRLRTILKI